MARIIMPSGGSLIKKPSEAVKEGKAVVEKKEEEKTIITKKEVEAALAEMHAGKREGLNVTAEVMSITPEMALNWLENDKNPVNRSVSDTRVEAYASEMSAGRWKVNNQGIALGKNGELYDGQHRLWAVVKSGATVNMLVVTGLAEGARATIDKLRTRKVGDDLSMIYNVARGNRVASCINFICILVGGRGSKRALMTGEALELMERYGNAIQWAVAFFSGNRSLDKGFVVAPLAYAYKTSPEVVTQFAEDIKVGANLNRVSPAWAVRNWVIEKLPFHREDARTTMLKVLAAVHAAIDGDELRTLRPSIQALKFFAKAHGEVKKIDEELE